MKNYLGLIPITILPMIFLSYDELSKETEKTCFGFMLSFIIFVTLYTMITHLKMNKWISLIITSILWVVSFFIKMNIYN